MTLALVAVLVAVAALVASSAWAWRSHGELQRLKARHAEIEARIPSQIQQERVSAASAERQKLQADLHDDIGAKLLTLLHSLEDPGQGDLVRAVIQDLRDVVSRHQQEPCTLLEALATIREESEGRLEVLGGALEWAQPADLPDPSLDEASTLHLFRIVREAITNALRHGHARSVRVRVARTGQTLLVDVTDDGPGLPEGQLERSGRGTTGMRVRAEALRGRIDWTAGTLGGTKVVLQFPLPGGAVTAPK